MKILLIIMAYAWTATFISALGKTFSRMPMLNKRDKKFMSILDRIYDVDHDPEDFTFILDQISAMIRGYAN